MSKLYYLRRQIAFLLAVTISIITFVPSYAADVSKIYRRLNIFEDRKLSVFGKTHFSMGYYQEGLEANAPPTFCLEPGKRMPNGESASFKLYTAMGDETIPGIGAAEKFVPITLAYDWMMEGNWRDPLRYGVVQVYIWGCVAGYAEEWGAQEAAQRELAKILGNRVISEYEEMAEYIESGLEEFNNSSNSGLPDWNGTYQKMAIEDGSYKLLLDISICPQLKDASWSFPDDNWSYQLNGDTIVFSYNGTSDPNGEVRSSEINGIGGSKFYAYIFTPGANSEYQRQVGRFANEEVSSCVSFTVGKTAPQIGSITFTPYRHSERFTSHYNIDLKKYCSETNQPLEGTTFNVWEDFDDAQLSGRNYHEGNPDGRTGCLYDNAFEGLPEARHVCDTVTTDADGYAAHRDVRSYRYSKTYCTGHPAPEWVEIPDEEYDELTGECTNEGEIEAAGAENERLYELWIAQQEMCEETCDFHVENMDEDNHEYDYSAQEEMLEDRDETYEKFIALEYVYHLEEKTARTGYILHGHHSDDQEIETITISSAENGGNACKTEVVAADERLDKEDQESEERLSLAAQLLRRAVIAVKAPKLGLGDLRRVEDVRTKTVLTASGSEAEREVYATASNADREYEGDLIASESNASRGLEDEREDDEGESDAEESDAEIIQGHYSYMWKEIKRPWLKIASASQITATEAEAQWEAPESWGPAFHRSYSDDIEVSESFPEFMDDDLDEIGTGSYGAPSQILYTFKVWDHRTEGEIHINKRDLELDRADSEISYGQSQGDATLEGAVYGLFAAQNLVHPDGKSGAIYHQNDLVAVAATDKNGDASFLAFTEKPGTRLDADGNILAPEGEGGEENLYDGSEILSGELGFGVVTCPDYASINGNQWIGRPLLLGSYYVRELSRSEGYELSVHGIASVETNRDAAGITTVREAGQVSVSAGLSDNNDMDADGSWNDFTVESYKTEDGYDITVTGYPAGTKFYRMGVERVKETGQAITGSTLQPKRDENGNIVYQRAKGGEYKIGPDGNPVVKEQTDQEKPQAETVSYRFRMSGYPQGEAEPEEIERWQELVGDFDYLRDEVNGMLQKAGYRLLTKDAGAPWYNLQLSGTTNADAGTEILDWFTTHNAWDCATVQDIFEDETEGTLWARLLYDYSKATEDYPAFYDAINQDLYIRKTMTVDGGAPESHYWIQYPKGRYTLGGTTATVGLRKEIPQDVTVSFGEEIKPLLEGVYQPSYEAYSPGEILLGSDGQPIPVMERVYIYTETEQMVDREQQTPVAASYDPKTGNYTIHVENEVDWERINMPEHTRYRAVTSRSAIEHEGDMVYYNRYLVDVAGAGVSVNATVSAFDAGSYIVSKVLVYPGQLTVSQDGGTRQKPLQVKQRVIKQAIRITKDISQASYDGVNTYGSLHNDPLTVILGLFNGGFGGQGTKLLSQFKFKAYLKTNLEAIYVDETGKIRSEDHYTPEFKGEVQKIYSPPEDGAGHPLLERNEDGTYNYIKFFDAMYAADKRTASPEDRDFMEEQFAVKYMDIAAYKQEILSRNPDMNGDAAYALALERARGEARAYLNIFDGMDDLLAIRWDSEAGGGSDGDPTTLQCNTKNGKDDYYNHSIMLPYGTYVIAEQVPAQFDGELANRHYERDYPKEITLPFVPDISVDGNTGDTVINGDVGNPFFFYNSKDKPEDLIRKYKIRFNEESHVIQAHRDDGDFVIYKYGLEPDMAPGMIRDESVSRSENAGIKDGVAYSGNETAGGELEIRDGVAVMRGVNTAVDGKYAAMLVPWTILEPATDRINPDTGNVETLTPAGSGENFNYVAYALEDFENKYDSSKLRIEKVDAETGENIIHSGALFKIYAAKRDVEKVGTNAAAGSGKVLFGEAVDAEGNPVVDADGARILYPRVGKSNGSSEDLPIRIGADGVPMYDETQLIRQRDTDGNETGIFQAYSTVREVVVDGQVRKENVGYIETYKPLGAGAYVLVEVQAPDGYTKSRPVAFEIYADGASYYEEQRNIDGTVDGWMAVPAMQYRYEVPVSGQFDKFQTETVSQVKVMDYPSRLEIYKVEDGDSMVGNQNGLEEQDRQGGMEASGGFTGETKVNDPGDLLMYEVRGRKEYLEERGDVRDIAYDPESMEWFGFVTKSFDGYSEQVIQGTENEFKSMDHVKPLYSLDGTFTGYGIRFDIPVGDAQLGLYRGMEIEKTGESTYKGVTAYFEDGKTVRIEDTNTGTHREIRIVGKDAGAAGLDVWDTVNVPNNPVNLYFYDLDAVSVRQGACSGELVVLDERGNEVCCADARTGMAYVYDDYGRIIAYTVGEDDGKELVQSIQVNQEGEVQTLYPDMATTDDENGLPIYYREGSVNPKDERWTTDGSTAPDGTAETSGGKHVITRLPFGAYILQEEQVPHSQGYVQARYQGLILRDTEETQKFFMQNEFTKTAFAKVDVRTQREIYGAEMTLYTAKKDEAGKPVLDENGGYIRDTVYKTWVSGYAYDDDGNLKYDSQGRVIRTTGPHWIDHIPIGPYVLEETVCPYGQGYTQTAAASIDVLETGNVQTFVMEDDFTAVDIRKYDARSGDVLYEESEAYLSLYPACLDGDGVPVTEPDGTPAYNREDEIITFRAATWKDGVEVAATGRLVPDAGGNHPIMKYDYVYKPIPNTLQGRFYYTEEGTTRLEYLPVGSYVLVEQENPNGYATAAPQLLTVRDTGHLVEVQKAGVGDQPLKLEVSKVNIAGGKEVAGAKLAVYPVMEDGTVSDEILVIHRPAEDGFYEDVAITWVSGSDGQYTEDDQAAGEIPEGFDVGDLKPHVIGYIPEGDYVLEETTTPYGFLQSARIPFAISDTCEAQTVEMVDEIPEGVLRIIKSDADDPDIRLAGAEFKLTNLTLERDCETVVTGEGGEAAFGPQPIGYLDENGKFAPYTYVCAEVKAAPGHMLTLPPWEFQFQYADHQTARILLDYNPTNDSNRVRVDKVIGGTELPLTGAHLQIERMDDADTPDVDEWEIVDQWISAGQPHYSSGLAAGKYRLVETKTPGEGYRVLAAPIEFEVQDGMTEVPLLVMENDTITAEIRKTAGISETLLAGARLRLIRVADGAVVDEWVSDSHAGRFIRGLGPGAYIIHEVEAPAGYKRGPDKEITVDRDGGDLQVFRFENYKKSSGGGDDTPPKPKEPYIYFKKVDINGTALPGAQFTFYNPDGSELAAATSGPDGRFGIKKPADGTYTFRETRAPSGYAILETVFEFTVHEDRTVNGAYLVEDRPLEVKLRKADGATGVGIEGAKLRITEAESGRCVLEAETDAGGELVFRPDCPGKYRAEETEAPSGYVRTETELEFEVLPDGTVRGNTLLYNFRVQKKIGRITAYYKTSLAREGNFRWREDTPELVQTGDDAPLEWIVFGIFVSLFGLTASGAALWRRRKRSGEADREET